MTNKKVTDLTNNTDPQVAAVVETLFESRASYQGQRSGDSASGGC